MPNENIRNIGFEDRISAVQALVPQVIQDDTPVLSSAIDTGSYPRSRILVVAEYNEVGATVHTLVFTVTESATSGGSYTAATVSTTAPTSASADYVQVFSVKRNLAKPFIKITGTGSHADVDGIMAASVLFIKPAT
jgi:hypothetical protein